MVISPKFHTPLGAEGVYFFNTTEYSSASLYTLNIQLRTPTSMGAFRKYKLKIN